MKNQFKIYILFILILIGTFTKMEAQEIKEQPIYVIVHGAWGGSWAFKKVDSMLTAKGALVYRPSLTGQGERVHLATTSIGLQTHIEDVVNLILYEDLRNIILVGHSYGGMVITGVADKVADRIQKMIYLDAFVPEDGESVKTLGTKEHWDWFAKMEKDGFMVPTWLSSPPKVPGDVPHPAKTLTDPIALKNAKRLSLASVYILTVDKGKKQEDDDFYTQYLRAMNKKWKVLLFEGDHNPQWSAVDALVKVLFENR